MRDSWNALSREAEEIVARTMESLPGELREVLDRLVILMEPRPSEEYLRNTWIEPDTLGVFEGPAAHEIADGECPRIILWLENIRDYAVDENTSFAEEVRTTLLHEIGHYLGWDEDDLADRGLD